MPDHPFRPSGHSNATGQKLDACLECGKTETAHDLVLSWGGEERRFPSIKDAKEAGVYVEVGRDLDQGNRSSGSAGQ